MKNSVFNYIAIVAIAISMAGCSSALKSNVTATATATILPSNMIFFFTGTTCPTGSVRATNANGRLLLAVTDHNQVGKTVGVALADQDDVKHLHSTTMTVSLPSHHIAGANSCCNTQGTSSGTHTTSSFNIDNEKSELPFIQLLVCKAS